MQGLTNGQPELTADEQKVVDYLSDQIASGKPPMISDQQMESELGIASEAISRLDRSKLRAGVIAELQRRNFDLSALMGNCSKYNACSVDRNLALADGEELARYEKEVAQDGSTFDDWTAPDFELPDTTGGSVSLSDYRGKNVALVFLSAHCFHSVDTLPILTKLKRKYAAEGLEIVPVFINSGDVDDVRSRALEMDVDYALVVSEDKQISKVYDSRMVPSTFLIDKQGRVTKKLVGFKDEATLDEAIAALVRS